MAYFCPLRCINLSKGANPDEMQHFIRVFTVCQRTHLGVLEFSQFRCISVLEGCINLSKSAYPDEMQHVAAFQQGLHCLPKNSFRGFRIFSISVYFCP